MVAAIVVQVWLYRDKSTGVPKGDATFTYEDPPSAPAAVKWFNGQDYKGGKLTVVLAEKKAPEPEAAAAYGGQGGYGGGSWDCWICAGHGPVLEEIVRW